MKLRTQDISRCFRRDFIRTCSSVTLKYSKPLGPIAKTIGSPVTTFTQIVRPQTAADTSASVQTDTVIMTRATTFRLPGRFRDLAGRSLPFSAVLSAATLFPGENVAATINREGAGHAIGPN